MRTLYTLTTNNIATVTDDDKPVFYVGAQCKSFQRIFLGAVLSSRASHTIFVTEEGREEERTDFLSSNVH